MISKFFSDIRYERTPVIFSTMTMESPEKCALLLQQHLQAGLTQARGAAPTGNWEKQPHSRFYSSEGTYSKVILTSLPSPVPPKKEIPPKTAGICPYHLAGQFNVLSVSGSTVVCTNNNCKNRHATLAHLTRAEVTAAVKSVAVKRIRDLCTAAINTHFKK
jgi:hypothetical protein